jgi:hypothetical protein
MRISMPARMARRMGQIAAVGAVALLLVGSAAAPAAAKPRHIANAHIDACFDNGGEVYTFYYLGVWGVGCTFPSGAEWVVTGSEP